MKKLMALLASLSVLCTIPAASASALYFEDTYEYEVIPKDQIDKYGYTMYSLDKTYKTGQYEKDGSYFNGCDLYHNHYESEYDFVVENEYYRDLKELIDRDYIVVPAEKIESFYLNVTGDPNYYPDSVNDKIRPAETYDYRICLNTVGDQDYYEVRLYDCYGMECKVTSDTGDAPIDFDKLKKIAPEIRYELNSSENTEQGYEKSYIFFTEFQKYDINGNLLTFKNHNLSEEDRDKILQCGNEHMVSFKYMRRYFFTIHYVDEYHSVEHANVEKAKAIYEKHGISFTIPGYDENYKLVDEEAAGEKAVLIPDEPLPGIEFFEILCEFADEGIATKAVQDPFEVARCYNEPEVELVANVKGDANDDGNLALSDSVTILQNIGNPDEYRLSAQGRYNADITGDKDGITNLDALTVQRKLLKLE